MPALRHFLLGLALGLSRLAAAIPTIQAKGSKLFTSDGNQFFIKGVAYQLTNSDPLANPSQCELDAALMKKLGANTVRVYHVEASANHDGCMSAFSSAGIYTFIDLDTFSTYIIPQGQTEPQWTQTMYSAYQKVMDAFQKYDNVAGFFVGNEMLTTGSSSVAAPYVKAAGRDMKAYRDSKGYRKIPIGYSAADIPALRPNLQNYLACGGNASEALDFYSLNAYEWCGQSSYQESGYSMLQKNATGYPIPIFLSETGCNTPEPRTFDDQAAILGSEMDGTWSGAIIYEWIEETNNYGLISYGPRANPTATGAGVEAGYTRTGQPTPVSPDFSNLSRQWATLSPSGVSMDAYNPTGNTPSCPAYTSGQWEVSGDVPLPTLGEKVGQATQASQTAATGSAGGGGGSGNAETANPSGASASASSATHSGNAASGLSHTRVASEGFVAVAVGAAVSLVLGFAVAL